MSDTTNTSKAANLAVRLNSRFQSLPNWNNLFKAVSEVITQRVTEKRALLAQVRDPQMFHRGDWINTGDNSRVVVNHIAVNGDGTSTLHVQAAFTSGAGAAQQMTVETTLKDREILINNCAFHGFKFFSDVLTDTDLARINEWVEQFWDRSGDEHFIHFIGFCLDLGLDIDQLLSEIVLDPRTGKERQAPAYPADPDTIEIGNDEYPWLEVDPPTPGLKHVVDGGTIYETSHVQVRYNAVDFPVIPPDKVRAIWTMFYYIGPIHLVLHRIIGEIPGIIDVETRMASPIVQLYESANIELELSGLIPNRYVATDGGLQFVESAFMLLDADFTQSNF